MNSFQGSKLKKIILSGADILRYNFAYRIIEDNIEYVQTAQKIIDELNSSVKIMIDFPINKIRLGDFSERLFPIKENDKLTFKSATFSPDCNEFVPVEVQKLGEKVKKYQTITIGDGEIALQVLEIIDINTIKVLVLNNGIIKYLKTFNINYHLDEKTLLEHYRCIIKKIKDLNPYYFAISFISDEFSNEVKKIIKNSNVHFKTIIKIEKEISKEKAIEICNDQFYDIILIDLGELGVNMPYEKLGIFEKKLIELAKQYKKPIWISTQILDSTVNNYIPNRAEIYNLTNLVMDGVEGIVFCHETTVGQRPSYSITVAKKIINQAKKSKYELTPNK